MNASHRSGVGAFPGPLLSLWLLLLPGSPAVAQGAWHVDLDVHTDVPLDIASTFHVGFGYRFF